MADLKIEEWQQRFEYRRKHWGHYQLDAEEIGELLEIIAEVRRLRGLVDAMQAMQTEDDNAIERWEDGWLLAVWDKGRSGFRHIKGFQHPCEALEALKKWKEATDGR